MCGLRVSLASGTVSTSNGKDTREIESSALTFIVEIEKKQAAGKYNWKFRPDSKEMPSE
jgi:hypothetical protein